MKKLYTLLAASVLAFPTLSHAEAQGWDIVKTPEGASHINFETTQMGAAFKGYFREFTGTINFDENDLASSHAAISIPLSSVEANSADRNKYLPTAEWFDTTKFPEAKFTTESIEKGDGDGKFIAKGKLIMKGVTMPVILPFTLKKTGDQAVMEGETTLNRLDYRIGLTYTDEQTVGLQVKLHIKITANKKAN